MAGNSICGTLDRRAVELGRGRVIQERRDKRNTLYSLHLPVVVCVGQAEDTHALRVWRQDGRHSGPVQPVSTAERVGWRNLDHAGAALLG